MQKAHVMLSVGIHLNSNIIPILHRVQISRLHSSADSQIHRKRNAPESLLFAQLPCFIRR